VSEHCEETLEGLRLFADRSLLFEPGTRYRSTPSDLVRFGTAIGSGRLLQPATVQLLQTPQRLASGRETSYGLGWDLQSVTLGGDETRSVGHDGEWMGGTVASLITFPVRGLVVGASGLPLHTRSTSRPSRARASRIAFQGSSERLAWSDISILVIR
jgi:CubicO group peptidase (beta-lactamase class C family)